MTYTLTLPPRGCEFVVVNIPLIFNDEIYQNHPVKNLRANAHYIKI